MNVGLVTHVLLCILNLYTIWYTWLLVVIQAVSTCLVMINLKWKTLVHTMFLKFLMYSKLLLTIWIVIKECCLTISYMLNYFLQMFSAQMTFTFKRE